MILPTPLEMTAVGTALSVGAVLVGWFLHNISLAIKMALVAGVVFLCASVAYGYERMGEDKIIPERDAAIARAVSAEAMLEKQREYAAGLVLQWNKAKDDSDALGKQLAKAHDELAKAIRDKVAALADAVRHQRVDASVVKLLNEPAATATADAGSKDQAGGTTVAAPDTGGGATDSDLGTVTGWALDLKERLHACRTQIIGWNTYFDSLWE